jgi:hypothetical protein
LIWRASEHVEPAGSSWSVAVPVIGLDADATLLALRPRIRLRFGE